MTLRLKVLIAFILTLLCLVVVLYITSRIIFLRSYLELERNDTRRNVERVLSSIEQEIAALNAFNYDWAAWDDTYSFIEDANTDYIESNLVDGTFSGSRLNLMLFFNSAGEMIYGKAFDMAEEEEVPLPARLLDHLSEESWLLRHPDEESSLAGILSLPDNPLLLSSWPIITSEDEGPIRGSLIMGRYLDEAEIDRLAQLTHLTFTVHDFNDQRLAPELQEILPSFAKGEIVVQPLSTEAVAGFGLIEDLYGEPALIVRVDLSRDIYHQGLASISYFILYLLVAGLVIGLMSLVLLERLVLSRLYQLSASVLKIGRQRDYTGRLAIRGGDELTGLADSINSMLGDLEKAAVDISTMNERMRSELAAAARVQGSVLPSRDLNLPGILCDWSFQPCQELGGDMFNIYLLDQRNIGIYVLDVSGHGVKAALLSVGLSKNLLPLPDQSTLIRLCSPKTSSYLLVSPLEVADALNRIYQLDPVSEYYFTFLYGILNLDSLEFRYVTAGHQGLIYQVKGAGAEVIQAASYPVGFVEQPGYEERVISCGPGDRLYLYTDGLVEAMNEDDQLLGAERLTAMINEAGSLPLKECISRIMEGISQWSGVRQLEDDMTLLAVEIRE